MQSQAFTVYSKFKQHFTSLKAKQEDPHILHQIENNRMYIIFNRPSRRNAFSMNMYFRFIELIRLANQLDQVKFIVITGKGSTFSSGNDLNNFKNEFMINLPLRLAQEAIGRMLHEFTVTIIQSDKPLFALVEGKAIGFAFTQLALYDKVFATQSCQFQAPLVKLAQGPECCSAYTFPLLFGKNVADELIVLGKIVSSKFLQKYNFLCSYNSINEAKSALQKHLQSLQQLDWASYTNARRLFKEGQKQKLIRISKLEIENLVERWMNPQLPLHFAKHLYSLKQKPKL